MLGRNKAISPRNRAHFWLVLYSVRLTESAVTDIICTSERMSNLKMGENIFILGESYEADIWTSFGLPWKDVSCL